MALETVLFILWFELKDEFHLTQFSLTQSIIQANAKVAFFDHKVSALINLEYDW